MDVLGVGDDLVGRKFADLLADLLVHFVEGEIVDAPGRKDVGPNLAAEGFAVGPAQEPANFGGKGGFHRRVAQAEVIGRIG